MYQSALHLSYNPFLTVLLNDTLFCNQSIFYELQLDYVNLQLGPEGTLPSCLFTHNFVLQRFSAKGNGIRGAVPNLPYRLDTGYSPVASLELSHNALTSFSVK